jgi:hypothetical protein
VLDPGRRTVTKGKRGRRAGTESWGYLNASAVMVITTGKEDVR